jgi:homoserine dehydrogenase
MGPVALAFLGFGNVGQALARLLLAKRSDLEERYGIAWRASGIYTAHHGILIDAGGIDLEQAVATLAGGGRLDADRGGEPVTGGLDFIEHCHAAVLFENSPVNYQDGEPAVSHLQAALEHGMHALTANKGPVVHAYHRLRQLADERQLTFGFESTVMDGAPIFSLWREALPAADLRSFRGVLNSTTNLILTLMETGQSLEQALGEAQRIGVAETDPRGDLEGWDAAIKVAALVTVLMGRRCTPQDVERQGITGLTTEDVRQAARQEMRWKLICQAEPIGDKIRARVAPEKIGRQDPLYAITGTSSALTFQSDVLGPLIIAESDPGPETTAYGLLADMVNALTHRQSPRRRFP